MNVRQLHKQIGTLLRLRPIPNRIGADGRDLSPSDDTWRLEAIFDKPARVRLVNPATGHVLELQSDNIKNYQSPDFLLLRCRIAISASGIAIEPIHALDTAAEQAARERAMRRPNGTFSYWVNVSGFPEDLRAFSADARKRFGHGTTAMATSATWGSASFLYEGPHAPQVIETLASKHHLRFVCSPAD